MKLIRTTAAFIAASTQNNNSIDICNMSSRKIAQVVPPTTSGPITRLIGTLDIDGKGTDHPLDQVDPFMLLDFAAIPESDKPPFGAHPHRGHSVVTILTQGQVKSWDSFTQKHTTIKAPSSYWVDAGCGVFHDETTIVPDPSDAKQHVSLFQLWISVKEEDRLKPAALQYDTNLPVFDAKDEEGCVVGSILYYVGGGISVQTPHPITVAYITQQPGTTLKFPVDPTHGGFAVHIAGTAKYGDAAGYTMQDNAVHVLADTNDEMEEFLEVTTPAGEAPTKYLVCVGEKIGEPWFKKLVANGAVIAKTAEEARDIASQVEKMSKEGLSSGNFAPFGAAPLSDQ